MDTANWNAPRAALSDKTARKEYGLTQEEIFEAVRQGKLQYRENHVHGNPYLRLLRQEVEALTKELRGQGAFAMQKIQTELKSVESQIRSCKSQLKQLEAQRNKLQDELERHS